MPNIRGVKEAEVVVRSKITCSLCGTVRYVDLPVLVKWTGGEMPNLSPREEQPVKCCRSCRRALIDFGNEKGVVKLVEHFLRYIGANELVVTGRSSIEPCDPNK